MLAGILVPLDGNDVTSHQFVSDLGINNDLVTPRKNTVQYNNVKITFSITSDAVTTTMSACAYSDKQGIKLIVDGDIVTDFNLILTEKHLCIEAIGYSAWGRLPETRYIEKFLFKDIEQVESRHVNSEDIINIKIKGKKEKVFKRKNKVHDSLVDDEMRILKGYLN